MALPVLPGPIPGLLPGTGPPSLPPVFATVCGSGGYSAQNTVTSGVPVPGTASLPVPVANTAGDWMFAVLAWRDTPGYPSPTFTVADDGDPPGGQPAGRNWWDPLAPGSSLSPGAGLVRCSIWVAPAARPCSTVFICPSSFTTAWAAIIWCVSGMQPWVSAAAAAGFANSATTVSTSMGAPFAQAFTVTCAGWDNLTSTPSQSPGGGWSAADVVTSSNGTDHQGDIGLASCWQVTSGPTTSTWTNATAVNLAAAQGNALVSAPALARPNAYWPVTLFEMAPGSGFQIAPDLVSWTPVTTASMSLDITQGHQYETAQLSTGEGTLMLDNPLGSFLPPGTGSLTGVTSGTPVRQRAAWTGGSWQMSFSGNGSSASPQGSTGQAFPVLPGQSYSSSAWLACSVPYPPGLTWLIAWYDSGGTFISSVSSPLVTGTAATLVTVTGTSPANAARAAVTAQANGIPPATTTFYASAAQPIP